MVTSTDVARRAGVSQATVSRVLNNPNSVKSGTREKVLRVMEEMNYKPNLIARSLVMNHTKTIALLSGTLKNGFFVETIDSMINLATSRGYKTLVFFEGEKEITDLLDTIRGNKVDGILLSAMKYDDPLFEELESWGIPFIQMSRRHRKGGNYVVLDNILATQLLTKHILELGHRRLAFIVGSTNASTFLERKMGFEKALQQVGMENLKEFIYPIEPITSEVAKTTRMLMNLPEPPTAIICSSDAMALVAMDTLLSMGLKVPEDVNLAGMDNIGITSHQAIQLTTIGHQMNSMGELAVDHLIDLIEEKVEAPVQQVLMPELIIRNTTTNLSK
ncbi:LacI family DNA-binding transcriptional regulator [Ammoniphilus resinae]|uniref:LacI family transcriptional regulator n=1 Tax=Ammoniphilus resinae TaxID=861532 RepID=A0ABS4GQV1_9BACL|nr:LacI family DNA-binding transcriptional regulator [Ammoniphilus resinae]MBP1932648.1 LacI family transcriptional regulator [Ammoniphilus resinae]